MVREYFVVRPRKFPFSVLPKKRLSFDLISLKEPMKEKKKLIASSLI